VRSPRPQGTRHLPLTDLAARIGASVSGDGQVAVTGVTHDSRAVAPGDLYAALPGLRTHGAVFAEAAVAAGARALLTDPDGADRVAAAGLSVPQLVVDRPREVLGEVAALVYGEPAADLVMVGITGTNGKTTTAYLVESGLRGLGSRTGLIGTVETRIGGERISSARTTPEATDLHAILAVMREAGTDAVVMEVSSHALAQHRVDGVRFDVVLFTNLSQDHLDYHHDMADYFATKSGLFTPARARRGIVCVDDEWGAELAQRSAIPVVTVGSRAQVPADWRVEPGAWPALTVTGPTGTLHLHCHLPGTFNLVNTALAAVVLVQLGYAVADIERAMAAEPVVPGRMEVVTGGAADPRCIVDYAHTPDAVDAALAAVRPTTAGRLVVVLGAGGDRDAGKRRAMGAAAARRADDVYVTDDNPRSEDPAAIRADVVAGALEESLSKPAAERPPVVNAASRGRVIAAAVARARAGRAQDNTVLVLGKGHETGQEVAGVVHPFDDRDALRAALQGVGYHPEQTGAPA
jgi:UDP-N-acetylmuramoyl-L-alanyl-D-glutamate--2,6-diaminopimelate ligase